jgi:predicted Zn-dependent peptidase
MSSRLFQEIRERRGLAYSVYSFRDLYQEAGMYGVYAGTMPGNVSEVLKIVEGVLDELTEEGATEAEVNRAKGHLRGSLLLSMEDPVNRMSRLGRSELIRGEILSVDQLLARVEAVTVDDVARVARELFQPAGQALTVIGPLDADDFPGWPTD